MYKVNVNMASTVKKEKLQIKTRLLSDCTATNKSASHSLECCMNVTIYSVTNICQGVVKKSI